MKKNMPLCAVIALLFLFSSCKMSGDKLAEYEGGSITRGEFYSWLESMQYSKDAILKDKAQQRNRLKQMGLDRLTLLEAKKSGYDKKPETEEILKLARRNFTANFYRKQLKDKLAFKEDVMRLSIIKLLVKNYKIVNNSRAKLSEAELQKELSAKTDAAKKIIAELNSGKPFQDMAKQYSDDFSKKNGGDIGYITKDMRSEDFWKAASGLSKGEYTKEPVRADNSIYVIKCEDRREINENNIADVIKDENQRNNIKNRIQLVSGKNYEESLTKASGVTFNESAAVSGAPNAEVYRVMDVVFLKSDLDKLIEFIFKKRGERGLQAMKADNRVKKDIAEKLFREEVLQKEALAKGVDKDPKFQKEWEFFRDYSIIGGYKNEIIMGTAAATQQEVLDEYNRNRDTAYTKIEKVNGKDVKRVMPFETVRERIELGLNNKKKSEMRRNWESGILSRYKFSLFESRLEGK